MYTHTRSRVVGPRLGTFSFSGDHARDGQRKELGLQQSRRQSLEVEAPTPPTVERQGHTDQRSAGMYTLIAPNESRRQKMQRVAEQELADLEKWKQQNRAKPVYSVPQRLGGSQSESEVRQKQQLQQMRSKYQQKLKRDEAIRLRKEAEEAELQQMKAIQREKSNKLEEKRQLQENLRRDTWREHHQYKTAEFLSRLDTDLRNRSACQMAPQAAPSSTWNKLLETKGQHQEEERAQIHQAEHWRVNSAFLDRLQGKSQPGGLEQSGGCWNMNSTNSWDL
ncbi:epithelial-stromal interaction protein 1 isoform X2 [Arvicola amphibius]|uniref:epithelial-stromal interaction protein 1 isoform X2 n=1 Tax=Arvicola amphibius TaxID=1047088 RepID=UPI0018E3509E|nr:epithelial-stromal interaction protein 1 isoform X2 [Arvicola amphibius]